MIAVRSCAHAVVVSPCGVDFVPVLFVSCPRLSLLSKTKTQKPILDCPSSCPVADHVLQALCRLDPRHRPPGQRRKDLPAVKCLVVADGRPGALAIPLSGSSLTVMPCLKPRRSLRGTALTSPLRSSLLCKYKVRHPQPPKISRSFTI